MERMLVVIFDNESKAYEGSRALSQLDEDGSITIHAQAVIQKTADGKVAVKQSGDDFPIRTLSGTAIGSLIGLLGGPVGLSIGAMAGALAGSVADLNAAGVDAEYLDDSAAALTPGKCAVIADVSEEWITPVDTRMKALGGAVYRAARQSIEDGQRARDVAALRAEIDQLKAEHARAQADQKANLKAKIDKLSARLQSELDQAQQRSEQIKSEAEAKIEALQKKGEKAHGALKATLDERIKRIRDDYDQSAARMKRLVAAELRQAAARVET